MFKNNNIRKSVMLIVEQRIDEAQKNYDEQEKVIERNLKYDIKELKTKADKDKITLSVELTKKVLGSILN